MYKWIFNNLKSLELQTKLLEACGWDEELMETYVSLVGEGLDPSKGSDIVLQAKNILAPVASEEVVEVMIEIIEKEAVETFKEILSPELLN